MAKSPEETQAENDQRENALANYGWSNALMNSNKELKGLFDQAVEGGWSPQRFAAEVRDTKWFKKHSEAWRTNQTLKITDPAEYANRKAKVTEQLRDNAAKIGAVVSEKQLGQMASNVLSFGWDDSQTQDALAGYVQTVSAGAMKGQYLGEAARNAQELRASARNNGYAISTKELNKWNKAIAAGDSTVEDYQAFMRRQAALTFPSFTTELEAGMDMRDIANPYINSMSRILEVNPEQIDLQDPTIRRALASKNEKTGKPEAMAMYDFEDSLRKDDRWQYTDNAKQEGANMLLNLGRRMGVVG